MGNTEQEQAEAVKHYIREVFIPEYAINFNKELSPSDIKFYGKIHFDRNRSDNELNMHCHLIVSRKDQSNKKKLSPLTNHKNTQKGTVTGGFNRVNLFKQAEQGFDKLFDYNRQQIESFFYYNTMKNCSIPEQFDVQEQEFTGNKSKEEFQSNKRKIEISLDSNQENLFSINFKNKKTDTVTFNATPYITTKQESNNSINQSLNQDEDQVLASSISLVSSKADLPYSPEEQNKKPKKKKRKLKRII